VIQTCFFFKDWFVDAHMAGTQSPGSPEWKQRCWRLAGPTRSNWSKESSSEGDPGRNFNPEVGFVERPDSNETYRRSDVKVRPSIPSVRRLQFEGFLLHAPDTTARFDQEWQNTSGRIPQRAYTDDDIVDIFMQRITTPFHIYKNVFIPNGLYHFTRHPI